jgi:AraC-like DNA-binding protein
VSLTHEGAGCRQRRQEFFRAPVHYNAARNAISIDLAVARRPLSSANAELAHANERVIKDYLAQLSGSPTVLRVKARLIDDMPSGPVPAAVIAAELHMSPRSLQRKLREEGTTYKAVLEETRRDLAKRLIEDEELSLSDITYMLGFSEVSSFSRSFKRWTGMAPSVVRRGNDVKTSL